MPKWSTAVMSTDKVRIHLCPLYSSRILKKMARKLSNVFCDISVRLVVLRCEAITDFAKTRNLSIVFKVASVNKILAFSMETERISEIFSWNTHFVHTSEYAAMSFLLSDWLYSDFMECDNTSYNIKGLFTWRCGTPGRWGNPVRWGNLPVHKMSHFKIEIWSRLH